MRIPSFGTGRKALSVLTVLFSAFAAFQPNAFALAPVSQGAIDGPSLNRLIAEKGLSQDGFEYVLNQKGASKADRETLKTGSNVRKRAVLNRISSGGLGTKEVNHLVKNRWLTLSGTALVWQSVAAGRFLEALPTPGEFKVHFSDVVPGVNAGSVQNTFVGKANFPKKFVLENGIALKLDDMKLQNRFLRTSELVRKKQALDVRWVRYGKISVQEPVLLVYPDRIQITQSSDVAYTTSAELSALKTHIFDEPTKKQAFDQVGNSNASIRTKIQNSKMAANRKNDASLAKINEVFAKDFNLSQTPEELETAMYDGMVTDCKANFQKSHDAAYDEKSVARYRAEYGADFEECSLANMRSQVSEWEKVLELTETIQFALIPPSQIAGALDILKQDPEDVRITRDQILSIFSSYGELIDFNLALPEEDDSGAIERPPQHENPFDSENYCETSGNPEKCRQLLSEKNDAGEKTYKKQLLNGFTLGEASSYEWGARLRVGFWKWKKTLASFNVGFHYAYGFGVRIPIEGEVSVNPYILDDWRGNSREYAIKTRAKTLNADEAYYRDVGLDGTKVFGGKEFVLELSAEATVDVWIIGDIVDEHISIPLLSILGSIARERLREAGFRNEEIDAMVQDNKLDKWKDFTPPLAGSDRINLAHAEVIVPLYSWAALEILGWVGFDADLDGELHAKCRNVHTQGGCPEDVTFERGNAWQSFTGTAVFNPQDSKSDELWVFSNYGIKLDRFKYVPEILVDVFVKWGASVHIPAWGKETWMTPEITVYAFEISGDSVALERHEGTEGMIDATAKNRLYSTNPDIRLDVPRISFSGNTDRADLLISGNTADATYNYYVANEPFNPNCSELNGNIWRPGSIVWENPYLDAVATKRFEVKARGCSAYGDQTQVVSAVKTLNNTAFDLRFTANEWDRLISTNSLLSVRNPYVDSGDLRVRYSLNENFLQGNDADCARGTAYDRNAKINADGVGRTTLRNEFDVTIRAIACNAAWRNIAAKRASQVFRVRNKSFNPNISFNEAIGHGSISSYVYPVAGYRTAYVHSSDWEDPVCRATWQQPNEWGAGRNVVLPNGDFLFVPGQTIRARTCIYDEAWRLVFSSGVVAGDSIRLPDNGMGVRENLDAIRERVEWELDHRMMEEIFAGFSLTGDDGLLNGMNEVLWDREITVDGIRQFNDMISDGGFKAGSLAGISEMRNLSNREVENRFSSMLTEGSIDRGSLSRIDSMLKTRTVSMRGLSRVASLYRNFHVTVKWADNAEIERNYKSADGGKPGKVGKAKSVPEDAYVREKLTEIQSTFLEAYRDHLNNIDATIQSFETSKANSADLATQQRYVEAITRLQRLREAYVDRYGDLEE